MPAGPAVPNATDPKWLNVDTAAQAFMEKDLGLDDEDSSAPAKPEEEASSADDQPQAESAPETEELPPEDVTGEEGESVPETAPQASSPSALVTVKVDGQEMQVTLEEAIRGYAREADYTRKTQKLADRERTFEAEQVAVRQERERYAQALKQVEDMVKPQEPDWSKLRAELSPEDWSARVAEWTLEQNQFRKVQDERQRAEIQVQEDRQKEFQTTIQRERDLALAAVPDWKDPVKEEAGVRDLMQYGVSQGFDRDNLRFAMATDHRTVLVLRKAMLYDKAKQSPTQRQLDAAKQQSTPTPTMRPGPAAEAARKPVTDLTRAKQTLAKTGKKEDAARVFARMIDVEEQSPRR